MHPCRLCMQCPADQHQLMAQVSRLDTLAGIALKYNVPVGACLRGRHGQLHAEPPTAHIAMHARVGRVTSHCTVHAGCCCCSCRLRNAFCALTPQLADIKRFNGLLSDTAMYGRDTLLIPKNLLPVG